MFLEMQDFNFRSKQIKFYQIYPHFTLFIQIIQILPKFAQILSKFDKILPKFAPNPLFSGVTDGGKGVQMPPWQLICRPLFRNGPSRSSASFAS